MYKNLILDLMVTLSVDALQPDVTKPYTGVAVMK